MNHKKCVRIIRRLFAGILVVGMVLTEVPAINVEAVNETPGQLQPGAGETEPEEERQEGEEGEPVDKNPGGEEKAPTDKPADDEEKEPGDERPVEGEREPVEEEMEPVEEGTEPENENPDDEEKYRPGGEEAGEEEKPEADYRVQVSGNDISGNDISGNDLTVREAEEDESRRVVGGYIEMPEDRDVSIVDEAAPIYDYEDEIAPLMAVSLPSAYIPETGTLPLTRDQNPYGSCWAHSAMALAEIDMMKNEDAPSTIDYSELHLAYFTYNGAVEDPLGGLEGDANRGIYDTNTPNFMQRGGNLNLAQQVLANWVGAADEAIAPYSRAEAVLEEGLPKELAFTDAVHLQNSFQINLQGNPEIAKRMIQKYGGIGTSYYDENQFYNEANKSYYCDTQKSANHAVTIVGWNDSFGADQFGEKHPEGDGAWLIRNSWLAGRDTDSLGRNTYFWMSYYDKSLAAGYAFDFEYSGNYDHNYQYDGGMKTGALKYNADSMYAANVFTAKACANGERLEAVGITFWKAQTPYAISVYTDLQDLNNPESGTLVGEANTSGTCGCEGFYTIPLASPVDLHANEAFSVVVKLESPIGAVGNVYLPYEVKSDSWFQCTTGAKEGQSFTKGNDGWKDFGTERKANLRIKAFTMDNDESTELPAKIELGDELKEGIEIGVGDSYQAFCTVLPRSAADRSVLWESDQPSTAAVDEKGRITGVADGTATITVTCAANKEVKRSFSVEVFSDLRGIQITGGSRVLAGETLTLQTVCSPSKPPSSVVQWISSDEKVLKVDANGVVTGVAPGYATVTAVSGEVTASKEMICEFPGFIWNDGYSKEIRWSPSAEGATIRWPGGMRVEAYRLYRYDSKSWEDKKLLVEIAVDPDKAGKASYSYLDQNVEGGKEYGYLVEADVSYLHAEKPQTKKTKRYTWKMPHYYPIAYHLNGGENSDNNPDYYRENYASNRIDNPKAREGYRFTGWYFDEDLARKLEGEYLPSDLTGPIALYAGWEQIYTITYELDGGVNAPSNPMTYVKSDVITLTDPVKEGYDFAGWYTDSGFTDQITGINGRCEDLILYAKWIEIPYRFKVTFDVQGHGNPPDGLYGIRAGSTIKAPAEPEAEGYIFKGWCKDAACTKDWDFEADIVQSNTTLYARWLKRSAQADSSFQLQELADIYYYTGTPCKPAVKIYDGETLLKAGRDYTVKYFNNINANAGGAMKKGDGKGADFNPALPYVQITGKGNYTDEVKVNFDIHRAVIADEKGDPTPKAALRCTDQLVTAKRGVLKPFGSMKYIKGMKRDKDYRVLLTAVRVTDEKGYAVSKGISFEKAQIPAGYAGEFLLTVEGLGNYAGSILKTIQVTDKNHLMKNAAITLGRDLKSIELVGESVELTPSKEISADTFIVKLGGVILTPNRDYEVGYLNDSNRRVGKATLVITGLGEYVGTRTTAFTIRGKAFTAKEVTVTGMENKVYTGRAILQNDAVLVYNYGKPDQRQLIYGKDYTVSYAKNINKGIASITFKGVAESGFSGSFKKSFQILAENMNEVKRGEGWNRIAVEYCKAGAKPVEQLVFTNAGGIRLKNGKDYTLSYKNNKLVAASTAEKPPTIVVKGKGNYQGTINIPFTITKSDIRSKLESGEITIRTNAVAYQPKKADNYAYKPAVKVWEGKTALRPGRDVVITYRNNTQADYAAYIKNPDAGNASLSAPVAVITVGRESCYRLGADSQGSSSELVVPLTIYQNKLTKNNIYVELSESTYTGTQAKPDVTVFYLNREGRQIPMTERQDYTLSYGANNRTGKNAGSVTINGVGLHYGGSVTVRFAIQRKKILY